MDQASAFQNTWAQFSVNGSGPKNITSWDPQHKLYYYRNEPPNNVIGFGPACATTEEQLLTQANQSGECETFARLMMGALAANGIPSQFVSITAQFQGTPVDFLVKDWNFIDPGSYPLGHPGLPPQYASFKYKLVLNQAAIDGHDLMAPPSTIQQCSTVNGAQQCLPKYGDLVSKATLPGQNSAPPSEKMFGSHFIVKVLPPPPGQPPVVDPSADQYFDPSYGVTYTDQFNFETKAVDGYALSISSNIFLVEKNAGLGQITFDH